MDPNVPEITVQTVEGAGDRKQQKKKGNIWKDEMFSAFHDQTDEFIKKWSMRELPEGVWQRGSRHGQPLVDPGPEGRNYSHCCTEWTPEWSTDSSDDGDAGLVDAEDTNLDECVVSFSQSPEEEASHRDCVIECIERSKLSMTEVTMISIPEEASCPAHDPGEVKRTPPSLQMEPLLDSLVDHVVDVEGDDDDDASHGAPTPDNTPQHSPSEEHQPSLSVATELGSDSALFSTLRSMAGAAAARDEACGQSQSGTPGTPSPDQGHSPERSPARSPTATASTLGRVWSRILRRGGSKTLAEPQPQPQTNVSEDDGDGDVDEGKTVKELLGLTIDPHSIDELEATLEEVRLDGDSDDPVVSYLVEEAEETERYERTEAIHRVTVEEVHDEDGACEANQSLSNPESRPSGLLSRLFSRSKTSTAQDVGQTESPSRVDTALELAADGIAVRRLKAPGKAEASSRDRLLQLHRPTLGTKQGRQTSRQARHSSKAAMRGSLPRILSRWLRHGEAGLWGAEGDAGKAVVSGLEPMDIRGPGTRGSGSHGRQPQQPAGPPLNRRGRVQTPTGSLPEEECSIHKGQEHIALSKQQAMAFSTEKKVSELGVQTDDFLLLNALQGLQVQRGTNTVMDQNFYDRFLS